MEKGHRSHTFYCLRLRAMLRRLRILSGAPALLLLLLLLGGGLGAGCAAGPAYTGQPAQSYARPSVAAASAGANGSIRSMQTDGSGQTGQTSGARRATPIAIQPVSAGPAFRQVNQNLAALAAQTQASPADYHLGSEDLLRADL